MGHGPLGLWLRPAHPRSRAMPALGVKTGKYLPMNNCPWAFMRAMLMGGIASRHRLKAEDAIKA